MISDFSPDCKTKFKMDCTSFLDFGKTEGDSDDTESPSVSPEYDIVFTSPPFYNYEIYSSEPTQSITGMKSCEEWITKFMMPYLDKCWSLLKFGGILCLYINDVFGAKYVNSVLNYIKFKYGQGCSEYQVFSGSKSRPQKFYVWKKV
jgi:DNA modification methylase